MSDISNSNNERLTFPQLLFRLGGQCHLEDNEIGGIKYYSYPSAKVAIFCLDDYKFGRDPHYISDYIEQEEVYAEVLKRHIEHNKKAFEQKQEKLKSEGWFVRRYWLSDTTNNPKKYAEDVLMCLSAARAVRNSSAKKPKRNIGINIPEDCRVTISEMVDGKVAKMMIFGEHSLNEDGTVMPFEQQMAIVSHYLHNKTHREESTYKDKAKGLIEDIYHFKVGGDISSVNSAAEDARQYNLFNDIFDVPFLPKDNTNFTFIDLFAGIGGFRIAMQNLGGRCVFSSEWDAAAQKSYLANFGEVPFGDITTEETKSYIPNGFDVLCAGFPCQAFSLAGKRRGFEETRGTLFFDVAEIIRRKRPRAFFLENVKGLAIHDHGKTLEVILNTLRNDLGYYVPDPQILNAMDFGVPQHRERIYIVGFRPDVCNEGFTYPSPTDKSKRFIDIREENPVAAKYYLSTQYLQTLINHKARHAAKGHGFGYEIIPDDGVSNAIVVGGMGRERNLVIDNRTTDLTPTTNIKGEYNHQGIRRMTPREWARLQGFPDEFRITVADASAYKQFGNSVAIPAIQATAEQIINRIL